MGRQRFPPAWADKVVPTQSGSHSSSPILSLAPELILLILSHLPPATLTVIPSVCSYFDQLLSLSSSWHSLYLQSFYPPLQDDDDVVVSTPWRTLFFRHHSLLNRISGARSTINTSSVQGSFSALYSSSSSSPLSISLSSKSLTTLAGGAHPSTIPIPIAATITAVTSSNDGQTLLFATEDGGIVTYKRDLQIWSGPVWFGNARAGGFDLVGEGARELIKLLAMKEDGNQWVAVVQGGFLRCYDRDREEMLWERRFEQEIVAVEWTAFKEVILLSLGTGELVMVKSSFGEEISRTEKGKEIEWTGIWNGQILYYRTGEEELHVGMDGRKRIPLPFKPEVGEKVSFNMHLGVVIVGLSSLSVKVYSLYSRSSPALPLRTFRPPTPYAATDTVSCILPLFPPAETTLRPKNRPPRSTPDIESSYPFISEEEFDKLGLAWIVGDKICVWKVGGKDLKGKSRKSGANLKKRVVGGRVEREIKTQLRDLSYEEDEISSARAMEDRYRIEGLNGDESFELALAMSADVGEDEELRLALERSLLDQ